MAPEYRMNCARAMSISMRIMRTAYLHLLVVQAAISQHRFTSQACTILLGKRMKAHKIIGITANVAAGVQVQCSLLTVYCTRPGDKRWVEGFGVLVGGQA